MSIGFEKMIGILRYNDKSLNSMDMSNGILGDIKHMKSLWKDQYGYPFYDNVSFYRKRNLDTASFWKFLAMMKKLLIKNQQKYDGIIFIVSCHAIKNDILLSDYNKDKNKGTVNITKIIQYFDSQNLKEYTNKPKIMFMDLYRDYTYISNKNIPNNNKISPNFAIYTTNVTETESDLLSSLNNTLSNNNSILDMKKPLKVLTKEINPELSELSNNKQSLSVVNTIPDPTYLVKLTANDDTTQIPNEINDIHYIKLRNILIKLHSIYPQKTLDILKCLKQDFDINNDDDDVDEILDNIINDIDADQDSSIKDFLNKTIDGKGINDIIMAFKFIINNYDKLS